MIQPMNVNELHKLKWQAKYLMSQYKGTPVGEGFKDVAHSISVLEHLLDWQECPYVYSDPKQDIWEEIRQERFIQEQKWGPKHDDQHSFDEWGRLLIGKIGKALGLSLLPYTDRKLWRHYLLQIATLTIAAIESSDRQQEQI